MVVIDGEHYPPVVESALEQLTDGGDQVLACVLAGGTEKLKGIEETVGDVPIRRGDDARAVLDDVLVEARPDEVVDLSDEPVLDYRRRHALAAVALFREVPYRGADFSFSPPPRPRLASKPSVAIIGTGKRTGKTAVAGFSARALTGAGRRPIIVAMGRGGPPEPEVVRGDELSPTPQDLLDIADAGKHAASDYVEDAMLGRVPTVGCRRCGGGLAGGVEFSNVDRGVEIANGIDGDTLLLEGSGAAIPPVHADATLLVVPVNAPEEYVSGYFGPYRILLADTVMVTMCEEPFGSPSRASSLVDAIRDAFRPRAREEEPEVRIVRTVFRPTPASSVEGADVYVATTAPEEAGTAIARHLAEEHGCHVAGTTHSLSDRSRLEDELGGFEGGADILLCEVKAAGIDVATRWALDRGLDVVYMDNVPMGVDGDDAEAAIVATAELAATRYERHEKR